MLCVVSLCTACTPATQSSQTPSVDRVQELSSQYDTAFGYATLDEKQQKNYAAIFAAVHDSVNVETLVKTEDKKSLPGITITLPQPLSDEKQATQLYEAFLQDNPQFFYLGAKYSFDGRQTGEKKEFNTLTLTYTMTTEERMEASKKLEEIVEQILAEMPQNSEFEKELYLHDALAKRCRYDEKAAFSSAPLTEYPLSFTTYGALVNGVAVCEGYSRAMQYLLLRANMQATVVTGYDTQNGAHMWNVVCVDDQQYHLDVTWDDKNDNVTHTYFNLTDEAIFQTHQLDGKTLGLSKMSDTKAQYYVYTESKLQTTSLEQVAAFVADALDKGKTVVDLQLSKEAFHNTLFFVRSQSWFSETVNAALKEGGQSLADYEFVYDETYYTITIYKK